MNSLIGLFCSACPWSHDRAVSSSLDITKNEGYRDMKQHSNWNGNLLILFIWTALVEYERNSLIVNVYGVHCIFFKITLICPIPWIAAYQCTTKKIPIHSIWESTACTNNDPEKKSQIYLLNNTESQFNKILQNCPVLLNPGILKPGFTNCTGEDREPSCTADSNPNDDKMFYLLIL